MRRTLILMVAALSFGATLLPAGVCAAMEGCPMSASSYSEHCHREKGATVAAADCCSQIAQQPALGSETSHWKPTFSPVAGTVLERLAEPPTGGVSAAATVSEAPVDEARLFILFASLLI
jgi:hypothetical protein